MEKPTNVDVVKKANVYYDGKVTSRTVFLQDGSRVTLGVILPGRYEFGTGVAEHMEILAGALGALLPGNEAWTTYEAGQAFDIPANSRFQVEAVQVADYLCAYLPE